MMGTGRGSGHCGELTGVELTVFASWMESFAVFQGPRRFLCLGNLD